MRKRKVVKEEGGRGQRRVREKREMESMKERMNEGRRRGKKEWKI